MFFPARLSNIDSVLPLVVTMTCCSLFVIVMLLSMTAMLLAVTHDSHVVFMTVMLLAVHNSNVAVHDLPCSFSCSVKVCGLGI